MKINFNWNENKVYSEKIKIIDRIKNKINIAIVSGDFPLFSGHTTNTFDYYVIYYARKCEDRKKLTEKLVNDYFVKDLKNFPDYKIEAEGVNAGFDGVTPSGWWSN